LAAHNPEINWETGVTPDSRLGNKSGIFHHNNENNQLKR